jgi:phosphate transport system substrate-binding protein
VTVTSETLSASLAERVAREGGADLALLSWVGDPNDEGQLWTEGLARDGVAVIVHPNSPLEETGQAQLQEIFRGRLQEWDGTALTVVSREDGAGTRAAFESIALEGADTTLNAVVMPSSEAMIEYVASTPGTIGYVSTLWLSPVAVDQSAQGQRLDSGVRVLPVEGLLPTEQAVGDGSYPLWRQLYLASRGEPYGEAREFAQWLLQGGGLGNPGAIVNP